MVISKLKSENMLFFIEYSIIYRNISPYLFVVLLLQFYLTNYYKIIGIYLI